mgnify:CR=1 FL=1
MLDLKMRNAVRVGEMDNTEKEFLRAYIKKYRDRLEELNSLKHPEDFSRPEWEVLTDIIEDLQYILGDYIA